MFRGGRRGGGRDRGTSTGRRGRGRGSFHASSDGAYATKSKLFACTSHSALLDAIRSGISDDTLDASGCCTALHLLAKMKHRSGTPHTNKPESDIHPQASMTSQESHDFITMLKLVEHTVKQTVTIQSRDMTKALWALTRLSLEPSVLSSLVTPLANRCTLLGDGFDAMGISSVVWSFSKLGCPLESTSLDILFGIAMRSVDAFNTQDMSNVLYAIARFHEQGAFASGDDTAYALAAKISSRVEAMHHRFKSEELSCVMWALSRLPTAAMATDAAQVVHALLPSARAALAKSGHQSIANFASAVAKLGVQDVAFVTALTDAVVTMGLDAFSEQELTNMAWAFAKLEVFDTRFFAPFQAAISTRASELTAQGLANGAWALAALHGSNSAATDDAGLTTSNKSSSSRDISTVAADTVRCLATAAVQRATTGFDTPQNVCSCLHSLALLGVSDPAVFKACGTAAVVQMNSFSASDVATLFVAFGKAAVTMANALLLACEQHLLSLMDSVDSQILTNVLWGYARQTRQPNPTLLDSLGRAIGKHVSKLQCRELCSIMWSLAMLDANPHKVLKQLVKRIPSLAPKMNAFDMGNVVYALAKFDFACGSRLRKVVAASVQSHIGAMGVGSIAYTVWGLTELALADKPLKKHLTRVVKARLADMHAQNIGMVAFAVGVGTAVESKLCRHVIKRATEVVSDMNWQTCGHVDVMLAQCGTMLSASDVGVLHRKLRKRVKALAQELSDTVVARTTAVETAGLECCDALLGVVTNGEPANSSAVSASVQSPAKSSGRSRPTKPTVLLIGEESGVLRKYLKTKRCKIVSWNRYMNQQHTHTDVATWPLLSAADGTGSKRGCILNIPSSREAFAMCTAAAASVLAAGESLYCHGHVDDRPMFLAARVVLTKYFEGVKEVKRTSATHAGGSSESAPTTQTTDSGNSKSSVPQNVVTSGFAFHMTRRTTNVDKGRAKAWRSKETIALMDLPALKWYTWPGLFAGGGVDIMTSFLLKHLPRALVDGGTSGSTQPGRTCRVLDFACGSGTISKYLLTKTPDARVTMLDADVLAIAAAKRNVPTADAHVASDCWEALTLPSDDQSSQITRGAVPTGSGATEYDWIVSNPPVHIGRSQHFGVLASCLAGAATYLARPHGTLVFVTQNYIPARLLASKHAGLNISLAASDGRFAVWVAQHTDTAPSPKAEGVGNKARADAATVVRSHQEPRKRKEVDNADTVVQGGMHKKRKTKHASK
eukprot:m.140915 g.140915  ORF g.140915 m.140915 type:complete len:1237 (+) comp17665_c0_seq17:163-3873(+)